jgi:protein O-mannosyl-transferase
MTTLHHPDIIKWKIGQITALILIIIAAIVSYYPSLNGPFLLDDFEAIPENESIKKIKNLEEILIPPANNPLGGRPLSNLSFAINYHYSGYATKSYRIANLCIHILNFLILYALLSKAIELNSPNRRYSYIPITISSLWAIHPISSSTISYIAQRTEAQMATFALLCFLFHLYSKNEKYRTPFRLLAIISLLISTGFKEICAVIPVLIFLYEYTFNYKSAGIEKWIRGNAIYFIGLTLCWPVIYYLRQTAGEQGVGHQYGVTTWKYILTQSRAIFEYFSCIIYPVNLNFDRGLDAYRANKLEYPYLALAISLILIHIWLLFKRPIYAFFGITYLVLLAPTSSLIPISHQPIAENRVYLASIPIITGMALILFQFKLKQNLLWIISIPVITALTVMTYSRNTFYSDEILIWSDTAAKSPRNYRAFNGIGNAYMDRSMYKEAADAYQKASELPPRSIISKMNYAVAIGATGDIEKSIEIIESAMIKNAVPRFAYIELSKHYQSLNQYDKALQLIRNAKIIFKNNPQLLRQEAITMLALDKANEAIEILKEAIEMDPAYIEAIDSLILAYIQNNDFGNAQKSLSVLKKFAHGHPRVKMLENLLDKIN